MNYYFDPRVLKARKEHQCMTCLLPIVPHEVYIMYPAKLGKGKFTYRRLCVECSYLLTQKSAGREEFRRGEFSERLIPNCLRKRRTEFRKNPEAAIRQMVSKMQGNESK